MKFVCSQKDLANAVNTVSKAIAVRTTLPILEGIRLKGENNIIEFYCTDLKIAIKTRISASFNESFSCVMPGRLFGEVVRRLPEDDVVIDMTPGQAGSYSVQIQCRDSKTTLVALDDSEFPETAEQEADNPIQIEEGTLRAMIRQTIFAVAQDNTRPIFTGELLEIENNSINLVALDGFKFASRSVPLEGMVENRRCVVPGRALLEVMRILEDTSEKIELHITNNNFMMKKGLTRVMTRLLEGEYIRYSQIIPKNETTSVRIDVDSLRSAISRAELIVQDERVNLVKLSIGVDEIIVSSQSESGNVRERIVCETQGNQMDVAFNIRYLSEVLRALECEEVMLNLTTAVSACVMKPVANESFLYLVLPSIHFLNIKFRR